MSDRTPTAAADTLTSLVGTALTVLRAAGVETTAAVSTGLMTAAADLGNAIDPHLDALGKIAGKAQAKMATPAQGTPATAARPTPARGPATTLTVEYTLVGQSGPLRRRQATAILAAAYPMLLELGAGSTGVVERRRELLDLSCPIVVAEYHLPSPGPGFSGGQLLLTGHSDWVVADVGVIVAKLTRTQTA